MMIRITANFLCVLFLLVFNIDTVLADDNNTDKHDHQKKLIPYSGAPPEIDLSEEELQRLASGEALFQELQLNNAKRGVAIFRVNANAAVVWSVLKEFSSYPEWIDDIKATEVYYENTNLISVKFVANGVFGTDTVWYAAHNYPDDDRNWGTWKLDYDKRSDLDDSVGFWSLLPVAGHAEQTDVVYSADVKLKGLLTSLFESSLIKSSLKNATQWVKEQAEARAKK
ncbi:MAG: SRPBCC family protein [Pseudomonadota bacterium]